ncbi:MAG: hypothetical protein PWP04_988 [Candidatus Atribacteria bacterium]|nr:hypothetical protein [Candidatus Atribacteria bacterium]
MAIEKLKSEVQEIWELFRETDKRMRETDERMKETDKKIEKLSESVQALTGKWGKFVESLVVPALPKMLGERGIEVDRIFQRVRAQKEGKEMEVDILAVDTEYAVLVEAKSTLKVEDVREHIERLDSFKEFFPEYRDRKVAGAVAGIVIEEDADKFAYRQGLFVITQTGETAQILNDDSFQPRLW